MSETHLRLTRSQFVSRRSCYSLLAPRFKGLSQKHFFIFAAQTFTSRTESQLLLVLALHFHWRPAETDLNPGIISKYFVEPCPAASWNSNLLYMKHFLFGERTSSAACMSYNITTATRIHRSKPQPYLVPPSSTFQVGCQFLVQWL